MPEYMHNNCKANQNHRIKLERYHLVGDINLVWQPMLAPEEGKLRNQFSDFRTSVDTNLLATWNINIAYSRQ